MQAALKAQIPSEGSVTPGPHSLHPVLHPQATQQPRQPPPLLPISLPSQEQQLHPPQGALLLLLVLTLLEWIRL
jgi:hypothetical protein